MSSDHHSRRAVGRPCRSGVATNRDGHPGASAFGRPRRASGCLICSPVVTSSAPNGNDRPVLSRRPAEHGDTTTKAAAAGSPNLRRAAPARRMSSSRSTLKPTIASDDGPAMRSPPGRYGRGGAAMGEPRANPSVRGGRPRADAPSPRGTPRNWPTVVRATHRGPPMNPIGGGVRKLK